MSTWRSRHDTSQQSFRVWFWVWMGCKRNLKGRREEPVVMFWRSELHFKGHAPPTHTRTHWLVWSTSLLEKGSSWALSTLLGPSPSACPHPGADRHAGSQQRLPVSAAAPLRRQQMWEAGAGATLSPGVNCLCWFRFIFALPLPHPVFLPDDQPCWPDTRYAEAVAFWHRHSSNSHIQCNPYNESIIPRCPLTSWPNQESSILAHSILFRGKNSLSS